MTEPRCSGVLAFGVTYEATATNTFITDAAGVRRRKFIDTSIAFCGQHEIWLSDGPDSNAPEEDIDWALLGDSAA